MTPINFALRPLQLPQDYVAIAHLFNTIKTEPVTAEQLQAEDRNIPAENHIRYDEDGQLGGFCRERIVAVTADGTVVGYAAAWRTPWAAPGNLASALVVDPAHKGQGIGSALAQHLEAWGQEIKASVLLHELPDHLPDSRSFAQQRGFAIERHMFQSTLELPLFDETPFAGVVEAVEAGGIRFLSLGQLLAATSADGTDADDPARLQTVVTALYDLLVRTAQDIPGSPMMPQFEEWQEQTQANAPDCVWVALDGERLVGMTQMFLLEQSGGLYNEYTGVDPSHRGRRIALALKLLAIHAARLSGAPYMRTDNDSENAPMLAVNQKLGYRPAPGHYRIVKRLASVEKYA